MVGKNAKKKSDRYRNPPVECPRCSKEIPEGTRQMKVGVREALRSGRWKILERWYHCPHCAHGFYFEVEAKPIERSL